jgi:hypothetical protein
LENGHEVANRDERSVFLAFLSGEKPLRVSCGQYFDARLHRLRRAESQESFRAGVIETGAYRAQDLIDEIVWRLLQHSSRLENGFALGKPRASAIA